MLFADLVSVKVVLNCSILHALVEIDVMNKQQTEHKIQTLLQAMSHAIEQQQWHQIRHVDQLLVATIAQAKSAPWYPDWQPKMQELKQQYQHFLTLLNDQHNELQRKMQQHQRDRDGIIAYKQRALESQR